MALEAYIIPFSNEPEEFSCSFGGKTLKFKTKWNDSFAQWQVDVIDAKTESVLSYGIPLVTGCDLLAPFDYLGLEGHIFVKSEGDDLPPTVDNLGKTCFVYYTPEDIPAFDGF